jgi:hypothetical protein
MESASIEQEIDFDTGAPLVPAPETALQIGVQFDSELTPLRTQAAALTITDDTSRTRAAIWLRDLLTPRRKAIEAFFAPLKWDAHLFHKRLCERESAVLANIPDTIVRSKLSTYDQEQERQRRAAEAETRRLADEAAKAQQYADAEAAMDAGDLEQAEAILEAPPPPVLMPPVAAVAPPPKVAGVATIDNWDAEVDCLIDLVRWVAESPADRVQYLQPCPSALRGAAKRLRDQLRIPGVRAVNRPGVRVGGSQR